MTSALTPVFSIGTVPVYGDLVLSPMDGFSDLPFRSLARELGSAISYTEFINAMDVLQKSPRLEPRLSYQESERPVVFQLFDDSPERLLEAALRVHELNPDVIDINLGCSAKTVAGRGAGAGLLRSPEKIARIFNLLSRALDIPVTGKIRLGWDDGSRNFVQVASIIEENGGQLLAVHGRTKAQGYGGNVDWDAIAEVVQAVSIPVIGNGDVRTVEDIDRLKKHTGCTGVMIGRGAIGNPWIFSRLDRQQVSDEYVQEVMLTHLERMLAFYGEELGLVRFRKHLSRYIAPARLSNDFHLRLMTASTPQQFLSLLDQIQPAARSA